MHVGEIVAEVEPAVESLLGSRDLRYHLIPLVVPGNTLSLLVVDGSTVAELAGGAHDGEIVVVGDGSFPCDFGHPVGLVWIAVLIRDEGRGDRAA